MTDSILNTIKPLVNVDVTDDNFDLEIITDINTALNELTEIGVGPENGFEITGDTETWSDFVGNIPDKKLLNAVKTYVHMDVRLMFDPPANGTLVEVINRKIAECTSRINYVVDNGG